jgi:hypothetical protein
MTVNSGANVTLDALTITNGKTGWFIGGSGILNEGTLIVGTTSTVSGNTGFYGGGIFNNTNSTLTINGTVNNNTAAGDGVAGGADIGALLSPYLDEIGKSGEPLDGDGRRAKVVALFSGCAEVLRQ